MRAASPDRVRTRPARGWYLGAVLSAVVAVTMCLLGWRQADQADRIDAHPVRVEGTVTQLPGGSGTYSQVAYLADGRRMTAADLWLPEAAKVGDPICLEHAADDLGAVRVCGKTYPQPVGVGLAQTSVPVAVLLCALCLYRIRRFRRTHPVGDRGGQGFTVAFAAEGMPALTNGRRSRRRRKGGRRALR
ncbi:hypothetical protein [Streptomyces sp. TLI_171]|uniref:hypothetical protein n=1 Tax=Streptomyces sp. TLI_171 TaxID=1938859 RepID=UPI000C62B3EF|nr:hypothetical protein [Streptomyces sp. TLI_171]RKE20704.1 hypothetical protein BX266_4074 [Streptomyces sp. TLI_171]